MNLLGNLGSQLVQFFLDDSLRSDLIKVIAVIVLGNQLESIKRALKSQVKRVDNHETRIQTLERMEEKTH